MARAHRLVTVRPSFLAVFACLWYLGYRLKSRKRPKAPAKPAPAQSPEKTPKQINRVENAKLHLGSYSFSEADRQKLKALPKQGLPEKADTADAQSALPDALDAVMNTTAIRQKTDSFRGNRLALILAVEASLSAQNPEFLTRKVENADFDQLLNAWTVLNDCAGAVTQGNTEKIRHFRDYIHNALLTRYGGSQGQHLVPAKLEGTGIHLDSRALTEWLKCNRLAAQYQLLGVIPLAEKEPVITLYEDGVKTRTYRLETEKDEDFTGKYFRISIRMGPQGNPSVPVAQIDGFISDTPEDRKMTLQDVGYRFEGHFLACGGESTKMRQEMNLEQDLPVKALKYPGYTTPSNVRLIGICPECGKSFCFYGYGFYMGQNEVAYSDDGLDCCQVSAHDVAREDWKCEVDGKTFRYYNAFCCPHCGTPYIDYRKFPETKKFGVSGCVHLGRKVYYDTDAST